jgi:hypothetical protein
MALVFLGVTLTDTQFFCPLSFTCGHAGLECSSCDSWSRRWHSLMLLYLHPNRKFLVKTERQCTHLDDKLGDHAFMHQIMGKEVDTLFQIENSPCAIHLCNTQIDQIKIPSWLDLQQWSANPTELCVASERCARVNQVQRKMWGGKKLNKQTL